MTRKYPIISSMTASLLPYRVVKTGTPTLTDVMNLTGELLQKGIQPTDDKQVKFNFIPTPGRDNIRLFDKAGKAQKTKAFLANFFVSGGGGNFNLYYYVLLEAVSSTEFIFSIHGLDYVFHKPYSPENVFGSLFQELRTRHPSVEITDWLDGGQLQPELASSHKGFAAVIGAGNSFMWG